MKSIKNKTKQTGSQTWFQQDIDVGRWEDSFSIAHSAFVPILVDSSRQNDVFTWNKSNSQIIKSLFVIK